MAKLFLLVDDGPRRKMTEPHPEADHAVADGSCPKCGDEPFKVAGHGRRPSKDDQAWEADGSCLKCGQYVGIIRLEVKTLFGVREDEAVFTGRWRIY